MEEVSFEIVAERSSIRTCGLLEEARSRPWVQGYQNKMTGDSEEGEIYRLGREER